MGNSFNHRARDGQVLGNDVFRIVHTQAEFKSQLAFPNPINEVVEFGKEAFLEAPAG